MARQNNKAMADASQRQAPTSRSFRVCFLICSMVLVGGIWLSSGTMAPYATSLSFAIISTPCQYLYNGDHAHFRATFLMLDGADRPLWEWSVVLRRILYPLFSYPFMKLLGFEIGGFFSSLLLHGVAFIAFIRFIRNRLGEQPAIIAMLMLALYPGIYYWAALPYSYSSIVPCCLFGMMALWQLSEETDFKRIYGFSLILGLIFLAYDLFPFFGVSAILILLWRRKFTVLLPVLILLVLPSVISNYVLWKIYRVPFTNANTMIYHTILGSYLKKPDLTSWLSLLRGFPKITYENYFFSNFLFLPALFAVLLALKLFLRKTELDLAESCLLMAATIFYLFLNLAPPYPGWQMRGLWIPRIYQPLFVVFVTFCCRDLSRYLNDPNRILKSLALLLLGVTLFGNGRISFGPILHSRYASRIYYRFYKHSPPDTLYDNISKHGRRPLGFCKS